MNTRVYMNVSFIAHTYTEKLYTEAFNSIIRPFGKEFTLEHKAMTMGLKIQNTICRIIELLELPITPQDFTEQFSSIANKLFADCDLMPGAERLLRHLKQNNVSIALGTSSSVDSYKIKSKKWKHIFDLFDHKVFGGSDPEVVQGKPHPDIFLVAAKRFSDNPDPSMCLVFEDAPNGVEAAVRADMQVVMVPDPNLPKYLAEKATLVLKSLEDFKPELFGLPPYTK
ncbi:probable pseudouridine-5'-phosphatase isoform X2 [Orussus abietinus]|uniref:probable pseudouridine-5'-phosphatase isoform X2 n=1 Tax=Orussus abietinus TaxID=222816 RepID=UPI0006251321|nr:probable pseudouridine-5'-phosphatase isoform X2 [Orussus abietinus]